jgi:hypothetical protein
MTGGPMPYVMDTGPYLSVLEDRLNNPATRAAILTSLRTGALVSSIAGLDSRSLDDDLKTPAQRIAVLNQCWFGMTPRAGGGWDPAPPGAFPTGFWNGYQGDPHAILRDGLIRAIEVSLGVDHGVDPVHHTREWPIEVSWVCQGPFFQCWVTWMKSPTGGHVSLTITTPAAKGLPVDARITRDVEKQEYKSPPPSNAFAAARGQWVVGHEDYTKTVKYSTIGSTIGVIKEPHVEWRAKNAAVKCVRPAEWEGGVLANGRSYIFP